MKKLMVYPLLMFGLAAMADDMPFWGEGSPATNRVALICESRVVQSFSSFTCSWQRFAMDQFRSVKPGLVFSFR